MAAGMLISWLIPGKLIGLFTVNEETIRIGITALHIISFGFIIVRRVCDLLRSTGRTRKGYTIFLYCVAAICHLSLFRQHFCLEKCTEANGVWLAFPVTEALTAVFCNHTISEGEMILKL